MLKSLALQCHTTFGLKRYRMTDMLKNTSVGDRGTGMFNIMQQFICCIHHGSVHHNIICPNSQGNSSLVRDLARLLVPSFSLKVIDGGETEIVRDNAIHERLVSSNIQADCDQRLFQNTLNKLTVKIAIGSTKQSAAITLQILIGNYCWYPDWIVYVGFVTLNVNAKEV